MSAIEENAQAVRSWRNQKVIERELKEWCSQEPDLLGITPTELTQPLTGSYSHRDSVQLALVRLAQQRVQLAGLVVLAQLTPALISLARLVSRRGLCRDLQTEYDVISLAWETVMLYPVDRRPHKIAANIKLDTLHRLTSTSKSATEFPLLRYEEVTLTRPHISVAVSGETAIDMQIDLVRLANKSFQRSATKRTTELACTLNMIVNGASTADIALNQNQKVTVVSSRLDRIRNQLQSYTTPTAA